MRWGRYGEARRLLTTALARAREYRYQRLHDMILVTLAHLDWFTGAWDGLAERAAALAELDAEPLLQLDAVLITALLDGAVGGTGTGTGTAPGGTVEERLRQVLDAGLRRGIVDVPLEPAAALARIRLAEGSAAEAVELTDGPAEVVARKDIWLWATEFAPVRTRALIADDRPREARKFVADLAEGLAGRSLPAADAALESCRGTLAEGEGRFAEAADAFGRAAAIWERLPRPYEALLAAERQVGCLRAAPERAGPQPQGGLAELTRVEAGFTALGAGADAERVRTVLRAAGAPVRQIWRGGRRGYGDQLSPRELEVVRLMLTGLTNPAIAQALSRSPKTIAAQLNSAMRKYGVTSRTALAVNVTRAGITPADL